MSDDISPELAEALVEMAKKAAKMYGAPEPEYITICRGDHSMPEEHVSTELEKEVLEAVTSYVYRRHRHLSRSNIIGFCEDDLDRLQTDKDGYLVFTVENVEVSEKEADPVDSTMNWYVNATLNFKVDDGGEDIEGSTDIYQCYRCGDEWCIEWYAS